MIFKSTMREHFHLDMRLAGKLNFARHLPPNA
jgi:hypothetical protein